jgi:NAD+ synthase
MNNKEKIDYIIDWLKKQLSISFQKGFVVGVSGGIDSALVSTLCAMTGSPVTVISMPIYQEKKQLSRAERHIQWLTRKYENVNPYTIDLSEPFTQIKKILPNEAKQEIALVNTRSRLRMLTLYAFANSQNYLVAGTGNKIEDFGIGFFTKYGDGGVDISPIADLVKSEVYNLARELEINEEILVAPPTDGLWDDDKTDEDQIGATYSDLEWAMEYCAGNENNIDVNLESNLTKRQKEILTIYLKRHQGAKHKMMMPPVCILPKG